MPEWFSDKGMLGLLNRVLSSRRGDRRAEKKDQQYPGHDRIDGRSRVELWHPEGGHQLGVKKPVGVGPQIEDAVRYVKLAGLSPKKSAQIILDAAKFERDIERRALTGIPKETPNLDTAKSILRSKHAYRARGDAEVKKKLKVR